MNTLRFYARGDDLVTDPRAPIVVGQATKRVGRTRIPPKDGAPAQFPATKEAFEISSSDVKTVNYLRRRVRDKSLWPADEQTAQACGVAFQPVRFDGGEWVPESAPKSTSDDATPKRSASLGKAKD